MRFAGVGSIFLVTIANPGNAYTNGDIVGIAGGTGGKLKVYSDASGKATALQINKVGTGYISTAGLGTTGGTGTGLTVNVAVATNGGVGIPPGSGAIQQTLPNGGMVRQRTIQHQHPGNGSYLGSNLIADANALLSRYERLKLASLAQFWLNGLSGADRTNWEAFGPSANGFNNFMHYNLLAYSVATLNTPPFLGQNYGDVTAQDFWNFSPAQPHAPTTSTNPLKTSLILTFTGNDRFTFTSITATASVTAFAEEILILGTRPWNSFWNKSTNPLIRLGRYFASASGQVFMPTDPNDTGTEPLQNLWQRVIGGAVTGQQITYGYRFMRSTRQGRPGPLHTTITEVL